jgi:hypothetical protein
MNAAKYLLGPQATLQTRKHSKLMKQKWLVSIGLAALLGLGSSVHAIPITGSIDMSGTATLNNIFLGSATEALSFQGVTVGGAPTGSFTGVTPGTSVTWNPFGWNPATTPVNPLWTFVFGGNTYEFDLASVAIANQNNSFLNLLGTGTLKRTGLDPTLGYWSFTISNPGGGAHANFQFTFANSQTAAVPDGGSSLMLLGAAFALMGFYVRRFRVTA